VAWKSKDTSGNYGIFANMFDETGYTLMNEITVKAYNTFQSSPGVTGLFNGGFVVAYR
jgi:hypothetical protein